MGVGAVEAEYEGDAVTEAVGLGEAIADEETEEVGASDFVGDGDKDDEASRLRDSDTERLVDLVLEGEMLPIVPAKL